MLHLFIIQIADCDNSCHMDTGSLFLSRLIYRNTSLPQPMLSAAAS